MIINIDQYPVFVRIGYFESERKHGQTLLVSLNIQIDVQKDVTMDLDNTLDYSLLFKCIDSTLKDREIKLIESAIQLLGAEITQQFKVVKKVEVKIQKNLLPGAINKGAIVTITETFHR